MRYFRDIFDISVEGFLNSIAAEPLGKIFFFEKFEFSEEDIEIDQKKRCFGQKLKFTQAIEIFLKKSKFFEKHKIWLKINMLAKNQNLVEKPKLSSKINIMPKKSEFCRKI